MRTALKILVVHLSVGAALWLFAVLALDPLSFYSAIFFFLWNAPGVWTLKALGLSPALDALGFGYGGLVTIGVTQVLLATALFALLRVRRIIGV
jgi:hypothetical protein